MRTHKSNIFHLIPLPYNKYVITTTITSNVLMDRDAHVYTKIDQ